MSEEIKNKPNSAYTTDYQDRRLFAIQKSTRPVFKNSRLQKIIEKARLKSRWYYNWRIDPLYSYDNIDDQMMAIQRSTKTLIKPMQPLHNKLRMKSSHYYKWHIRPEAHKVHWAALIIYTIAVVTGVIYGSFANPAPSKANIDFAPGITEKTVDYSKIYSSVKPEAKEITEKRTENTKAFKNPDGTTQYIVSSGILHYKGNDGKWYNIDSSILPNKDNTGFEMDQSIYKAKFEKNFLSNPLLTTTKENQSLTMKPGDLSWSNNTKDELISSPKEVEATSAGHDVTYKNAYGPGLDFGYETQDLQLNKKLTIPTLESLPTSNLASNEDLSLKLQLAFKADQNLQIFIDDKLWDGNEITLENKNIVFKKDNEVIWQLTPAKAWDSSSPQGRTIYSSSAVEKPSSSVIPTAAEGSLNSSIINGKTTIKKTNDTINTSIAFPYSFLKTAVYPVTIDPATVYANADDGQIAGLDFGGVYETAHNTTASSFNLSDVGGTMNVGQSYAGYYLVARSFLRFDTSAIEDTATVGQANLHLRATVDSSATDFDIDIYKTDWASTLSANREANYVTAHNATKDVTLRNTSGMALNTDYTSPNLDTSRIIRDGYSYFILKSSRDASATVPTGDEVVSIASQDNATPAYRPYLSVTTTTSDFTWDGGGDGVSWSDANNWDKNAGYPDTNDDKAIINIGSASIVTPTGGALTIGELSIAAGYSGTLALGNNMAITNAGGATGNLTIAAGTLTTTNAGTDRTLTVDNNTTISGTGTLTANTSVITVGGSWDASVGTFTRGTSLVKLTGTGTVTSKYGSDFYDLWCAYSGKTTTLSGNTIIRHKVTLYGDSTGYVAGSYSNFQFYSSTPTDFIASNGATICGTASACTAGIYLYGAVATTMVLPAGTFYNSIDLAGNDAAGTAKYELAGNIAIRGIMTIYGNVASRSSVLDTKGYNISSRTDFSWAPRIVLGVNGTTSRFGQVVNSSQTTDSTISLDNNIEIYSGAGSSKLDGSGTGATPKTININIKGNWLNNDTYIPGTGTVDFQKTSATQTLNSGGTAAANTFNNVTHSGAGTLQLLTNAINIDGNFTNSAGTFDTNSLDMTVAGSWTNSATFTAGTRTVTFDGAGGSTQTITGSTTFYNLTAQAAAARTIKFTAGSTTTVTNTLDIDGSAGQLLTLNSVTNGSYWKLNVSSASPAGTYLAVKDSNATGGNQITATSSTNTSNNLNWNFTGSGIAIGGSCKAFDESTNCPNSETVKVAVNGVIQPQTATTAAGAFSIASIGNLSANDVVTIFIDNVAEAREANVVTVYDGTGDITGTLLYEDHLTIGSDDNQTITNANLAMYDNSASADEDIFFEVDANNDLNTDATNQTTQDKLYIKTGNTYRPDSASSGNVTTTHMTIVGTITADANTFTVAGNYINTSGIFTYGTSTIVLTGAAPTFTSGGSGAGKQLYNLTCVTPGQTITLSGNIAVYGTVTVGSTSGNKVTITGAYMTNYNLTNPIVFNGQYNQNPGYNINSFDVYLRGAGNGVVPAGTYGSLYITPGGSYTMTMQGDITANYIMVYYYGATPILDTSTNNYSITTTTLNVGHTNDNTAHGKLITHNSAITVNGDFTIASSHVVNDNVVDATGTSTWTLKGSWTINNGVFTPGNSTVNMTATATGKTITSNGQAFNNLTFNGVGGGWTAQDNMQVNGNLTVTAGTFSASDKTIIVGGNWDSSAGTFSYGSSTVVLNGTGTLKTAVATSFKNLSMAADTKTTTLLSRLQIDGVVTLGTGTLTGSAYAFWIVTSSGTPLVNAGASINLERIAFYPSGPNSTISVPGGNYGTLGSLEFCSASSNNTVNILGDITVNGIIWVVTVSGGSGNIVNTQNKSLTANQISFGTATGNSATLNLGSSTVDIGTGGVNMSSDGGAYTLNMGSATITNAGPWENVHGTGTISLVAGTSVITMDGTTAQTITSSAQPFYNLTLNNTGTDGTANDDIVLADALDVNNNFTITNGQLRLDTNDPNLAISGNLSIGAAGTWTKQDGGMPTNTFDGALTTSTITDNSTGGPQNLGFVTVNKSSIIPASNLLTLASNAKVDTMTIAANNILNLGTGGYTFEIANSGITPNVLTNSGTLTPGTSTVKYTATNSTGNINVPTLPYNSLQFTPGSAEVYDMTGSLTTTKAMTGSLTVDANAILNTYVGTTSYDLSCVNLTTNGTLYSGTAESVGTSVLTISGDWNNSSGIFTRGKSEIIMTGANNNFSTTPSSNTLYKFTVNSGAKTNIILNSPWVNNQTTVSGELAIPTTKSLSAAGGLTINNGGIISGAGKFYRSASNASTNIVNNGTISVANFVYGISTGSTTAPITATNYGGDLTITGSNAASVTGVISAGTLTVGGTLSIGSTVNTYTITMDNTVNNVNITTGALVLGTTGQANKYNIFKPGTGTITVNGAVTVYASDASGDNKIDSTGVATNWNISGNISNSDTWIPGTGTVTLNGAAAQSVTSNNATYNNLTITNPSASGVTFADNLTVTGTFADNTAGSKLTFTQSATYTLANIDMDGTAASKVTMVSSVPGTHYHFNVAAATPQVSYVNVKDADASGGTKIDASNNCTDSLGNTNWLFSAGNTIDGSLYDNIGGAKITATKTIKVSVNGGVATQVFSTNGDFTITSLANLAPNDIITIFVSGDTVKASTVTKVSAAGALTTIDLYQNYTTIRHEGSIANIANSDLDIADNLGNSDMQFSTSSNNTTFTAGLYILTGKTYTPGGDAAMTNMNIAGTYTAGNYTITCSGNWDSSAGTFTYNTSTVVMTGASVTLKTNTSASSTLYKFTIGSGANVTIQNIGGPFGGATQATNLVTISGTLTIPSGKYFSTYLDNGGLTIDNGGVLTGAGTFHRYINNNTPDITNNGTISVTLFIYNVMPNSTTAKITPITTSGSVIVTLNGGSSAGANAFVSAGNFNITGTFSLISPVSYTMTLDNTVNNSSFTTGSFYIGQNGWPAWYSCFKPGTGTITVNGDVTVYPSDASGDNKIDMTGVNPTWNVSGSWTNSDTVVPGNSTINFTATTTGKTITSGTGGLGNTNFTGTGGGWTLQDNLTANSINVAAGNLVDNAKTITVNGSISFTPDNGLTSTGTWIMAANGGLTNASFNNTNRMKVFHINSGITATTSGQFTQASKLVMDANSRLSGSVDFRVQYFTGDDPIDMDSSALINSVIYYYPMTATTYNQKAIYSTSTIIMGAVTSGKVIMTDNWSIGNLWIFGNSASINEATAYVLDTNTKNLTIAGYLKFGHTTFGVGKGYSKILFSSGTHTVSGNASIYGAGTAGFADLGSSILNFAGNVDLTGITVTPGTSTVNMTATTTGKTITSASQAFNNLNFTGVGGGWTLQDNLTAKTLSVTAGNLIDNGKTVTVNGNISIANTAGLLTSTGSWIQGASGNISNPYSPNSIKELQISNDVASVRTSNVFAKKVVLGSNTVSSGAGILWLWSMTADNFFVQGTNSNVTGTMYFDTIGGRSQQAVNITGSLEVTTGSGAQGTLAMSDNWNIGGNLMVWGSGANNTTASAILDTNTKNLTVSGYLRLGASVVSKPNAYQGKIMFSTGTHTISGNVLVAGQYSYGYFDLGSSNISVGGNIDFTYSTVTPGTSTVNMTATTTGKTITSASQAFNNLNFIGTGGGWTLQDNLTASNIRLDDGTMTDNGKTVTINGNITIDNEASRLTSTGTWIQGASGNISNANTSNFFKNLTIAGNGVASSMTDNIYIGNTGGGTLTMGPGTLNGGSKTLSLYSNSNDALTVSNLIVGTSIYKFNFILLASVTQKAITIPSSKIIDAIYVSTSGYNLTATGDFNFGNNGVEFYSTAGAPTTYTNMASYALTAGTIYIGYYNTNVSGYLKLGTNPNHSFAGITKGGLNIATGNTIDFGSSTTAASDNINFTGITVTPGTSTLNFTKTSSTQTLNSASQALNNVTHSGAGNLQLTTNNLDINGSFTNSNGVFDANGLNVNVAKDWNISGGSFSAGATPGTQTVTFDSTNTATVSGSTAFNNLVMNTTTDGAKTINFAAGSTQTIANGKTWNLAGASGKVLTLRSTTPNTPWYFNIPAAMTTGADYIDVQDSQNIANTNQITPQTNVTDSGNNEPGWLFAPTTPTSLVQKDGSDNVLAVGAWAKTSSIKFGASVGDTANLDTEYLCVEKDLIGTAFSNTEDTCGTGVAYSGTPVTASVTVSGLSDATEYHWQVRGKDAAGNYSAWVAYPTGTTNLESVRDFGIDTSAPTSGTVNDGTSTDVDYNDGSLSTLSANWTGIDAAVSGLNKYEYAIGTTAGGTDIKTWTNNTTSTTVTDSSLTLRTGKTYYFSIRTTDNAGNVSTPINSNGQAVAPTLTFGYLGGDTVTFDTLGPNNSYTDSTKETILQTSTNAFGGYVIKARAIDQLRSPSNINLTIAHYLGLNSAPTTWSGTGFGYSTSDDNLGGGTPDRFTAGGTKYAGWTGDAPGDIIADHTSNVVGTPISNEQFTIKYRVTTDPLTAAGSYRTMIVYTAIPQY